MNESTRLAALDAVEESNDSTSSDKDTLVGSNKEETSKPALVSTETKAVNRSKGIVYLCLVATALAVGISVFFFLSNNETSVMKAEFNVLAIDIAEETDANARRAFGQLTELSTFFTAHLLSTNTSWPNVTLPMFDLIVQRAQEQAEIQLIAFGPLVSATNKDSWEEYAVEHQSWILEAVSYRGWNVTLAPIEGIRPFDDEYLNAHTGDHEGGHSDHEHEGRLLTGKKGNAGTDIRYPHPQVDRPGALRRLVHEGDTEPGLDLLGDKMVPLWQLSPPPLNTSNVGLDLAAHPILGHLFEDVMVKKTALLSQSFDIHFLIQGEHNEHPRSVLVQPVFSDFRNDSEVVAFLLAGINWDSYFHRALPEASHSIFVDVEESCGSGFSYVVNGTGYEYLGPDRDGLNESKRSDVLHSFDFAKVASVGADEHIHDSESGAASDLSQAHCTYKIFVTPTTEFQESYQTTTPIVYTILVVAVFAFTILVFVVYDFLVQRRQRKLLTTAERTTAIVSSLFPKEVHDRIMEQVEQEALLGAEAKKPAGLSRNAKSQMQDFFSEGEGASATPRLKSKPIADLFPEATIMFGDIVGFTAWSSTREPCQVFTLLETLYGAFDQLARRRRVFKVETVGDCYVAVAGLPEPRRDHAVVMARFARDCLYRMHELTKALEVELGPDTTDLGMRFGLHTGQVTAGVLRGEKARFQLFGDTVNTTSRIETTGARNKIHLSQEMADALVASGKEKWIYPREDKVVAKGKGEMTTYWMKVEATSQDRGTSTRHTTSSDASISGDHDASYRVRGSRVVGGTGTDRSSGKLDRLVDWNTEVLARLLREVVAHRGASSSYSSSREAPLSAERLAELEQRSVGSNAACASDEVKEIVELPPCDAGPWASRDEAAASIVLGTEVEAQLRSFVQTIAALYRDANSFHNFEHASHVTMSVVKLLSRIVAPQSDLDPFKQQEQPPLHDPTYGITSDPLTRFAVVLSALIHDVDHQGVPNVQLVKEGYPQAASYQNRSVAENNSVDLAWKLLLDESFTDLRRVIYRTESEFRRFRQLLVNAVLATDIMDPDLGAARKARWAKAFAVVAESPISVDKGLLLEPESVQVNRKATIVIEHLIQASDVAHTMQHWHIYRKWNARFFEECFDAYSQGRSDKDPSENWYQGELGFFDFYILPLAKKLKDCGVFGVSSDEYLNYALNNRKQWEGSGRQVVEEMVEGVRARHHHRLSQKQQHQPSDNATTIEAAAVVSDVHGGSTAPETSAAVVAIEVERPKSGLGDLSAESVEAGEGEAPPPNGMATVLTITTTMTPPGETRGRVDI